MLQPLCAWKPVALQQDSDPELRTTLCGDPGARRVAGDRDRHVAEDHRVDGDDLAAGVEERSPRVTRREGDVRPDVSRGRAPPSPRSAKLAHPANDAGTHGPDPAPRVANGVDQFADPQGVRVPYRSRWQIPVISLQREQREV